MKIALDVDGVLADVIQSWLNYNNTKRQIITKSQISEWDFWKNFKINRYDFYNELSLCWKNWKSIPPTEKELSSSINQLNALGDVDIVTAREKSTNSYVKQWLKSQHITYNEYVSVIDGPQKSKLDYDIFIDDSPLNAKKIITENKIVLLYDQPWNTNIQDVSIHRISSLATAKNVISSIS